MRLSAYKRGFSRSCCSANFVHPMENLQLAGPKRGRRVIIKKARILLVHLQSTRKQKRKIFEGSIDSFLAGDDNEVNVMF